jgi:hypothetical protein
VSELEQLIAEQRRDDRSHRVFGISLDAHPNLFHRRSRRLVTDPRPGTNGCYTSLGCRCDKCRAAAAEAKRDWRRRNPTQRKVRQPDRLCCSDCGSENIDRRRVYA